MELVWWHQILALATIQSFAELTFLGRYSVSGVNRLLGKPVTKYILHTLDPECLLGLHARHIYP